jgi:hypothetical protein
VAPLAQSRAERRDVATALDGCDFFFEGRSEKGGTSSHVLAVTRAPRGVTSWLLSERGAARGATSWHLSQRGDRFFSGGVRSFERGAVIFPRRRGQDDYAANALV